MEKYKDPSQREEPPSVFLYIHSYILANWPSLFTVYSCHFNLATAYEHAEGVEFHTWQAALAYTSIPI